MTYPHFIRPAAELEITRALDYYAINVPHKLVDFEAAIDEVIGRITESPQHARERVADVRCAFVHGFPYQAWYVWHENQRVVEVIAFLHARQDRAPIVERHGPV